MIYLLFFVFVVVATLPPGTDCIQNHIRGAREQVFDVSALLPPWELSMRLRHLSPEVASKHGARCLDGSLPTFYYRQNQEHLRTMRAVIFLEGGGWCAQNNTRTFNSCAARAATSLGSTANDRDARPDLGGIMSSDCTINPGFCSMNSTSHFFIRYCDGSSFTSNRKGTADVGGMELYFRGRANLMATLDTLVNDFGLADKEEVILTGGSAGGVAVYMALDAAGEHLKNHGFKGTYVGFPDAGLFMGNHVKSYHTSSWIQNWRDAYDLWHPTESLNSECIKNFRGMNEDIFQPWMCLLTENMVEHIKTPYFAMNSAVDMYYASAVLGIKCAWKPNESRRCTEGEIDKIQLLQLDFEETYLAKLRAGNPSNGCFIDNCIVHEQNVGYCSSQGVDNCVGWNKYQAFTATDIDLDSKKYVSRGTPQRAFHLWFFGQIMGTEDAYLSSIQNVWIVDQSEIPGGNPTCSSLYMGFSMTQGEGVAFE